MDDLPIPDYDDYFAALDASSPARILGSRPVILPVEFSRGCWWGARHHCTFCGLNALSMTFRSKQPDRGLAELKALMARHGSVHIDAVDNILDMTYLSSLCAELADEHYDLNLFFEVKANLTRVQLRMLSLAGILRIQPGIESLSTRVLGLMRKGSTKLINIALLKWARYYRIDVSWNLLLGFPGETDEDYLEQIDSMRWLVHLQPPSGSSRIWLERYSPNFTDPSLGFTCVRPMPCYAHIYPSDLDHHKIAYFFDYQVEDTCSPEVEAQLAKAVKEWKECHRREKPSLVYQRVPGRVTVIDRRSEQSRQLVLSGWQADAYHACGERIRRDRALTSELQDDGHDVDLPAVRRFLDAGVREGIVASDDDHYLALALPENPGW